MQGKKQNKDFVKLPSSYALSDYERIFFPNWLYKFWRYQPIFFWLLFLASVIFYFFILAWLNGYKIDFHKIKVAHNISQTTDKLYSSVYKVGGVLINTDRLMQIRLFNNQFAYEIKPKKFYSLPIGIYNLELKGDKKKHVRTKILIYKEYVYKTTFYVPNQKLQHVGSLNVLKNIQLSPKSATVKFFPVVNDKHSFLVKAGQKVFLLTIEYSRFLRKFNYAIDDLTNVKFVLPQGLNKFDLSKELDSLKFNRNQTHLVGVNKKFIIVVNLESKKGVVWFNKWHMMLDDLLITSTNIYFYSDKTLFSIENGKLIKKRIGSGWLSYFGNELFFWKVSSVSRKGLILDVFQLDNGRQELVTHNLSVPSLKIAQIGFWNEDFYYVIVGKRVYILPFGENALDFSEWNTKQKIAREFEKIHPNYFPIQIKTMGEEIFFYKDFENVSKVMLKESKIADCKYVVSEKSYIGILCFSSDAIRLDRLTGYYSFENTNDNVSLYKNLVIEYKQNGVIYAFNPFVYQDPTLPFNIKGQLNNVIGIMDNFVFQWDSKHNILQIYEL